MEVTYKNKDLTIAKRVEDLLSRMTIDEKIGQLSQFSAKLSIAEEIKDLVRQGKVSSRVMASTAFAGKDKQEITGLTQNKELQRIAVEESALGIPLLDGWDIIHGCRVIFPIPLAQAASWCPELVERASAIAAKETAANGVHWVFAPMLDIARDPRWGRIIEGFGEDPYLCSVMAKASIRGFQGNDLAKQGKVAACAKHYIAYGLSEGGRDYSVCDCSEHELKNVYLPPFKAAVEAGVATIMASFNEIGGEPVTGSYHLLTEILKEELGFDGFVVSDWYAIHQLINQGVAKDRKEAAYLAFNAGVDMDMVDSCYQDYIKELVEEGRISEDRLNDAVRRILTVKFRTGLFENPYPDLEADRSLKQEDLDCAKQLAQKSIVLLKNQNGILPLPKKGLKIAVVGPLANAKRPLLGSWTPNNETKDVISIVEAIRTAAPEAGLITASEMTDEILMAVRRADVVVLALGESHLRNGEHSCIADLDLPAGQNELLRAVCQFQKPVVAVICAGRPLAITEVDQLADAVLYAWHPGHRGGTTIAEILFGDVNPSGKLPVTFPRSTGQIPIYYNHKPNARHIDEYYHPDSVDYLNITGKPLYSFGYGLSYTDFVYDQIETDKKEITIDESVKISVRVTNTGKYAGEEVVQCYLRDNVSEMTRPVRELKGFQRVYLQPGESKIVTFTLDKDSLSYYGRGGRFVAEPGEFTVFIGGNCMAELKTSFVLVE